MAIIDTERSEVLTEPPIKPPSRWPDSGDFWRLWLIGSLQFGVRWLDTVAIGIFTYQTTRSAFLVTMMMVLRILPMALFGMVTGAAADRFDGRTILMVTLGTSCMTSSMLTLLAFTGHLAIWHVAIATFIAGIVWSSDIPLRRLMIGRVVGADRMASAMSLDAGSSNASRMAGPAIGGLVLATWGIGGCFAIGAVVFFIGFVVAASIRFRSPARTHVGGMFLDNIEAAIKLAIRERPLAGFFAVTFIFNLFALPVLSLVPVIGQDHLHLGARGIGFLASMDGVGALAGAAMCFLYARPEHYSRIYTYSTIGYLIALMAMSVLPNPFLAGIALMIAGFGNAGFGIMQSTLIFRGVKPEMRALLLGLLTVAIGTGPLGFVQMGLLAENFGAQVAVLVSGTEGLVAMILTRPLWRSIRASAD